MTNPRRCRGRPGKDVPYDMDDTKRHVMLAGREILLAAQGALRFCKSYVEHTPESRSRPHILKFFQNAIVVADDLGGSILKTSPVAKAARGITKTFFDSMEEEMKSAPPRKSTRRRKPIQRKSEAGSKKHEAGRSRK